MGSYGQEYSALTIATLLKEHLSPAPDVIAVDSFAVRLFLTQLSDGRFI